MTKFFVNQDSKKVVCVMTTNILGDKVVVKSQATCSPTDTFNEESGKRLAHLRALTKLKVKKLKKYTKLMEYYNKYIIPQMTVLNTKFDSTQKSLETIKSELNTLLNEL